MKSSVIILGGGVAGMSAAHELAERGYRVTIFEKQATLPGGKARSIPVEAFTSPGFGHLPGEHGFRFFPGFYRHIIDTMERIPTSGQRNAADNLVEAPKMMLTRLGKNPIQLPTGFPDGPDDIRLIIDAVFNTDTGLKPGESKVILQKIWQLMTSSRARRYGEYEHQGWWEYCEADQYSEDYQKLFVDGLTRTLVAAKARKANTFTNGNILLQMLFSAARRDEPNDRILNGPTNEQWLTPWLNYLQNIGVHYVHDSEVVELKVTEGNIAEVVVVQKGKHSAHQADYFICALPVERAATVATASGLANHDPVFHNLPVLAGHVAWMNGIQFFLHEDVPINAGHIIMSDSPWALTAISQAQFWPGFNWPQYGDGSVRGVLSIDVSDWDTPGWLIKKPAKECTKCEVIQEVWYQLCQNVNHDQELLKSENVFGVYVDEALVFDEGILKGERLCNDMRFAKKIKLGSSSAVENEEPLLVNEPGSWALRPTVETKIDNLYLASDYVQTDTNLATMEAANEAARLAVNALLEKSGDTKAAPCNLWKLEEPNWLLYYKWIDHKRYKKGLPWKKPRIPWYALPASWLLRIFGHHRYL